MRPRRVYLPLSHDQLQALASERHLKAPVRGFAAGALGPVESRRSAAAEEEAEYTAFAAAAAHAREALGPARRVIASADAPASSLEEVAGAPDGTDGVETTEDLPLRLVVSLHIDEAASTPTEGTEDGDTEPGDDTEDVTEPELLWYDITELDTVVEELGLG